MNGSGTSTDPYIVVTIADLRSMTAGIDKCYKLGNDIDCAGYSWTSAAINCKRLDGAGHAISNILSGGAIYSSVNEISPEFVNINLDNIGLVNADKTKYLTLFENCHIKLINSKATFTYDSYNVGNTLFSSVDECLFNNSNVSIKIKASKLPSYGVFGSFGTYNSSFNIDYTIVSGGVTMGVLLGAVWNWYDGTPGDFVYATGSINTETGVYTGFTPYLFGSDSVAFIDETYLYEFKTSYFAIKTDLPLYFGNENTYLDKPDKPEAFDFKANCIYDSDEAPYMSFDKLPEVL